MTVTEKITPVITIRFMGNSREWFDGSCYETKTKRQTLSITFHVKTTSWKINFWINWLKSVVNSNNTFSDKGPLPHNSQVNICSL